MMNISNTKRLITEVESFDYSDFNNQKYQTLKEIMGLLLTTEIRLEFSELGINEMAVYRVRPNESEKLFRTPNDLWHPPAKDTKMSRLNFWEKPLMYTAINPSTALIEVNAHKLKRVTLAKFSLFDTVTRMVPVGLIPNSELNKKLDERSRLIFNFLSREVKKKVKGDERQKYLPTIIFATCILNNELHDGFIYESVATEFSGLNFAFKPDSARRLLKPTEFRCLEIINVNSATDFRVKCSYESRGPFENMDSTINWEQVENCPTHQVDANFNYQDDW